MTYTHCGEVAQVCLNGIIGLLSNLRKFFLVLLVLPFLAEPALARILYVDANSRGGSGSADAPFKSINQAAQIARPGDTILVRRGIYSGHVKVYKNGRPGAPIVIKGERGAVIDGSRTRVDTLVEIGGSHVVFEGFEVRNASRTGIGLWGTFHSVVRKNTVVGSQGAGIWVGHSQRGRSGQNLVEQNVIFDNCRMNIARKRTSGWPIGIAIAVSDQSIVRSNTVYENHGEGIGVLSSSNVKVHNNTVYDNFSVNIYLDNAPNSYVQANTIGSTGNRTFFRHKRPPAGVLIANERTRHQMASRGIKVVSNSLIGVEDVSYGTYGVNSGLHNSVIAPNKVQSTRWLVPPRGTPGS
jgi:nitrous oxidase accessory protein NosD